MGEISIIASALDRKRCIVPNEQLAPCKTLPSVYECLCEWVNVTCVVKLFEWSADQESTV